MGSGASSATSCLAGFFALRSFALITIWVISRESGREARTSRPHWFYTRILRVPKCFFRQAFSLTPKSVHKLGYKNPIGVLRSLEQLVLLGLFLLSGFGFLLIPQSDEPVRASPALRLVPEFALLIGIGAWRALPMRRFQLFQ